MGETHRSYEPIYFATLSAIEDRHFWFRARNKVVAKLVAQIVPRLATGYRALEIGCGGGNVLRVIERSCPGGLVVGMDLFAEGLQYARRRTSCPLVQGDVHNPPFGTQFDMIGLFDVLEHLPDDVQVLRQLHSLLEPGGVLLMTVPAHQSLWSYFDEASRHCRRYELPELQRKLMCAGYRVEYVTQYMASIFFVVRLRRWLAPLRGPGRAGQSVSSYDLALRELRVVPLVNELLTLLLAGEARFVEQRRRLPIGVSLLAVARKDSGSGEDIA